MAWLKDLFVGNINIQPYIPPRKDHCSGARVPADRIQNTLLTRKTWHVFMWPH
jgi:hypothetical protein